MDNTNDPKNCETRQHSFFARRLISEKRNAFKYPHSQSGIVVPVRHIEKVNPQK